jgi:pimeloyl-ACP methyl ester carboxylesterase
MMKYLFVHGGPGFNSIPEKNLWNEKFNQKGHEIFFWNEPSANRPSNIEFSVDNAFENQKESLLKFINEQINGDFIIIAHSYGAFLTHSILNEISQTVIKIIYIAPVLNLKELDENFMTISALDYEKNGNIQSATLIQDLIKTLPATFNEERFASILEAFKNPNVFNYYWSNSDAQMNYNKYFAQEGHEFDLTSYKAVREDIKNEKATETYQIPVMAFFGAYDPISIMRNELKNLYTCYSNVEPQVFNSSSHYPHIEEEELFLKKLTIESRESEFNL